MCFYHILHKNSIGHLLRTSQDSFRPPQSFRKEMEKIFYYIFIYIYEYSICCVCRTLSKIWHKTTLTSMGARRGAIATPPLENHKTYLLLLFPFLGAF